MEKALERPRGESAGGVVSASDTHAPSKTAETASSDSGASTVATTGGDDAHPPGDGSTTETRLEVIQTLPVIQTPQLELVVRQVALLCWRELLNF